MPRRAADKFTYELAPTVSAVSPVAGLPAGGTSVVITGTGFGGASAVYFGAYPVTIYTINSSTQISTFSPAQAAGTVDVTVTTSLGTSATSGADQFAYEAAPSVSALSPVAGPLSGGTTVAVTGTGFSGASTVDFGVYSATYTVISSTQISATSPAHSAGTVDLTVTTPVGASALSAADHFAYEAVPTVSALSPLAGPLAGGTTVAVTGTGFSGASAVDFGAVAATYTVSSSTQISATSPAAPAGTVDLTVTTPVGTSATSAADHFSLRGRAQRQRHQPGGRPAVGRHHRDRHRHQPHRGQRGQLRLGRRQRLHGRLLHPAERHLAGGAGGHGRPHRHHPVGHQRHQRRRPLQLRGRAHRQRPQPAGRRLAGGTTVAVTGTGFSGASAVDFGVYSATYTVISSTQISATSPAAPAGTVDLTVTTPSGTSATSAADHFSYEAGPSVSALSPLAGPLSGGTTVAVTGTGFSGASAVDFGVLAASAYTVASATQLSATSPAQAAGTVDLTVTTPSGVSATSAADHFSYEAGPSVSALSPLAGPLSGGTTVAVTGTNFTGASAVSFGSTSATSYTVSSATQLSATSPAGTGTVDLTVTTPSGVSATSAADQFSYEAAPSVSALSPVAGLPAGGTSVSVTGTNFTGASAVHFGAVVATTYSVISSTQISATSPAASAGTVDLTVTTPSGTSATSAADHFSYEAAPTVSALSPVAGLPAGGTTVAVTGTGFSGASAVDFGVLAATTYSVISSTQISATSPAASAGTVDLTVTTPVGTSATSAADHFSYEAAPVVSALSPVAGPLASPTVVSVTGTGFSGASAVYFGLVAATTYTVSSSTSLSATTAPQAAGTVDVIVTTPVGTSATSTADHFTYEATPTVSALSPVAGQPAGGTSVVITGTGFGGASTVDFGLVATTIYTINSSTQITATAPAHAAGTVDVTVTTPLGTSATSAADQFSYETAPTVSAVSPVAGLPAGGTSVVITGTGFGGASAVYFGAYPVTIYTINSSTQISTFSPAQAAGTVDVTVTTSLGTSATSGADQFAYEAAPSVSALSPVAGPLSGGTTVAVTGTGFSGASTVDFGVYSATYTVISSTQISATSPAHSAGTVDLTVTTPVGASALSAADHFAYEAVPTVSALSPLAGPWRAAPPWPSPAPASAGPAPSTSGRWRPLTP